jgi:hypothetical protein
MTHPIGTLVRIDAFDVETFHRTLADSRGLNVNGLYDVQALSERNLFDVTIGKIYQIIGSDDLGDDYFIDDIGDRNYCACSDGSGFAIFTVMPSDTGMPKVSPLSEDQIKDILLNMPANYSSLDLFRVIEKAHKIV